MGRGPGRGQGQGLKKKTPRPGPLTGAGRGIEAGARRFRGPGGPVTNTSEEHSRIKMRASSQLTEFRMELIGATLNRCILAISIVKHIVTAFERREVPRRRIKMALD